MRYFQQEHLFSHLSSLLFHLLFHLLFLSLLFHLLFSLSLCLPFLSLCVSIALLCLSLSVSVWCCVWECMCGLWCVCRVAVVVVVIVVCVCGGTLKTPCVDSKRPRVYIQNVPVYAGNTRTRGKACARVASTHGNVWNVHTVASWMNKRRGVIVGSAYQEKSTQSPHLRQRGPPKKPLDLTYLFFSLRIGREQHFPDSSNHSLYLMKLLSSSYPEGHCDGDQISPLSPSLTSDKHTVTASASGKGIPPQTRDDTCLRNRRRPRLIARCGDELQQ